MDVFTQLYIETILWAELDDTRPLDEKYNQASFAPETIQRIQADCKRFQEENPEVHENPSLGGYHFWLQRNGHGAGFRDGDWECEGKLANAGLAFGRLDLYVGDDGLLYFL